MPNFLERRRDHQDEQEARRLRDEQGRRGWLLSWYRRDDGWNARLSCPRDPDTREGLGPTRVGAIRGVVDALTAALAVADGP